MVEVRNDELNVKKIAESGQCFRLNPAGEGRYRLLAHGRALTLTQTEQSVLLDCTQEVFDALWRQYFDWDTDYAAIRNSVDPADAYLTRSAAFGAGVRILRQDTWETLITFILSQRKNIPAIKGCVELLCSRFGEPIPGAEAFAFPKPEALANTELECLLGCSLGYRGKYVLAAARMAVSGALDFTATESLSDGALYEKLLTVPGVGKKVADCTMLFGFHRLGRFPVDVWIERVLAREYPNGFPLERYGAFAGVLQQYMFYYERKSSNN
ncbi:MAG: DNA glycosylase [Clostridiaceae bacterium]